MSRRIDISSPSSIIFGDELKVASDAKNEVILYVETFEVSTQVNSMMSESEEIRENSIVVDC
jgi:hypothetical protein